MLLNERIQSEVNDIYLRARRENGILKNKQSVKNGQQLRSKRNKLG